MDWDFFGTLEFWRLGFAGGAQRRRLFVAVDQFVGERGDGGAAEIADEENPEVAPRLQAHERDADEVAHLMAWLERLGRAGCSVITHLSGDIAIAPMEARMVVPSAPASMFTRYESRSNFGV